MRARKPWTLFLRLLCGWNVRFTGTDLVKRCGSTSYDMNDGVYRTRLREVNGLLGRGRNPLFPTSIVVAIIFVATPKGRAYIPALADPRRDGADAPRACLKSRLLDPPGADRAPVSLRT